MIDMSRLTVEVPGWACQIARWEVHVGERSGAPGDPVEVEAGPVRVHLDAFFDHPPIQATVRLELSLEVPENAKVTLSPPLDALRAVASGLLP